VPALADGPLYRLVHDDLSEFWEPVWFADFAAHVGEHRLAFVGEADLSGLRNELPVELEPDVWELAGGDRIAFEQYSDLLMPRVFRQSVLCRAGRDVAVEPAPEQAERLHWAARPNVEPLAGGTGAAALAELDRVRPHALAFETLRAALGTDAGELGAALLDAFRRERLIPHAGPLHVATEPGERPEVSRLARWQAAQGPELTSLVYQTVRMEEPAARALIALLDGTRDRAAIRADLQARTGLELSEEDLETNLVALTRLFLMVPHDIT
jgi:hypothetical protein